MSGLFRDLFRLFMGKSDTSGEPEYQAFLDREDYVGALPLLRAAMQRDDPRAMLAFGLMLILARGVEQDMEDGMLWLRQSAVRGYTPGQLMLGAYLAADVVGKHRNVEEASYWLHLAASKGIAAAVESLSTLVLKHPSVVGVHFSHEELMALMRKAHRPKVSH
jgi:TPR repeat protein